MVKGFGHRFWVLSPEAAAVNEALQAATTWRQLNTVLEQQVRQAVGVHANSKTYTLAQGPRLASNNRTAFFPVIQHNSWGQVSGLSCCLGCWVLSPEAVAVNEALGAATTWRQLNTVLEYWGCVDL